MPDLKNLYRVLYIYFFNQIVDIKSQIVIKIKKKKMEVLKVKIDFEKSISGSRHESPKISNNEFLSLK